MRPVVVRLVVEGEASVEAVVRHFLKSVLEKMGDLFGCSEIMSYLCTRKKRTGVLVMQTTCILSSVGRATDS